MLRLALAAAAALTLSACSTYGDDYAYGYPGHTYASEMAYYDNAYGPLYDGYWDGDVFYYRVTPSGAYVRDDARHFRRDPYTGYTVYRGGRGYRWH
jgi:hypothetical protein